LGYPGLSDGGGLQLWVSPDGAKRWRLAYRFNEAQKTLAIGVYPAIGLKDAREARECAKRLLAEGEDPSQARRQAKASTRLDLFKTNERGFEVFIFGVHRIYPCFVGHDRKMNVSPRFK